MREREDIEWIRRKNLDGVATLVTDLTPGYSTASKIHTFATNHLRRHYAKRGFENCALGRVCYKWRLPSKEAAQLKDPRKDSTPTRGARQTGSRSWQKMTGGRWRVPEVPGAPKVIGSMGAKGWTSAESETGKYL